MRQLHFGFLWARFWSHPMGKWQRLLNARQKNQLNEFEQTKAYSLSIENNLEKHMQSDDRLRLKNFAIGPEIALPNLDRRRLAFHKARDFPQAVESLGHSFQCFPGPLRSAPGRTGIALLRRLVMRGRPASIASAQTIGSPSQKSLRVGTIMACARAYA